MSELREVVAKNITELRQKNKMTQLTLAEKLNYSDKAISKWERGESFPDIFMLKKIADLFEVGVDYLFCEDHSETRKVENAISKTIKRNRILISFLATMLIWLIATVSFVAMGLVRENPIIPSWILFVYAIPLSAVVTLVFNSIWGKPKLNYLIITVIVWSILLSVHITYLTVFSVNVWIIYVIGIPSQIIIGLWAGINNPKAKTKKKRKEKKK